MRRLIDIHTHHPHPDIISPRMAGIHPWNAEKDIAMPNFEECDIVGETGLDYQCPADHTIQQQLFEQHLKAAIEWDKPIVIHNVKAIDDILRILGRYPMLRGVVFHNFIGSLQLAETLLKRGYYLSIGQRSLRSPKTRQVIASMDISKLFCETDEAPSGSIKEVYMEVAKLRNISVNTLLDHIENNYKTLFDKDPLLG